MKRIISILPLLILIGVGVAMLVSGGLDRFSPDRLLAEHAHLQARIAEHPFRSGLIQIGLTTLVIATGLPGALVIILAGGMLFGIVMGTILSGIGLTIGALLLFLASQQAFGDGTGKAPALVEKLRAGYLAHPVSYTCFLRLVPFFPFGGVTVALAWLRCPLWLFASATAGGGALMVCIETALGAGLAKNIGTNHAVNLSLFSDPVVIVPLLAMGFLALTPVVVGKRRGARAARRSNPGD